MDVKKMLPPGSRVFNLMSNTLVKPTETEAGPIKDEPPVPIRRPNKKKRAKDVLVKSSAARLAKLGFDPIEQQVKMYDEVSLQIYRLTHNPDKTLKDKFPTQALASLMAVKQKIANDLMRYGYARVPEKVEVEHGGEGVMPININLTLEPPVEDAEIYDGDSE